MSEPTPAQLATIVYFNGGPTPQQQGVRITQATYDACERRGWVEQISEWPYRRTTDAGRRAAGLDALATATPATSQRPVANSTPEQLREISDPAQRERAAATALDAARQLVTELSMLRREAVRDLYVLHGTWAKVGAAMGTSAQRAQHIATR